MKKILITGSNSYIGNSVKNYLLQYPESYSVNVRDTIGWEPEQSDFSDYDVVFNVAGIAHIKEKKENEHLYYEINRDLSIKIAKTAKAVGVKQYILLSSMSVYGMITGEINKNTLASPKTYYGKSKLQADLEIEKLVDENFKFACLRPPMVYGKGCKGNYQSLRKIALNFPIFPKYHNKRSMIFIGNLCEFIKECIDMEKSGVFFPQNSNYTDTTELVRIIAKYHEKKIYFTSFFNILLKTLNVNIIKKVFGDLIYEKIDTISKYDFDESIRLTEN